MVGEFECEFECESAFAGAVAEEFGCPRDPLQDGVAVGVQADRGAGCVVGFVEEHPHRLAEPCRAGFVRGERAERRGDEFGGAVRVLRCQRGDFEVAVEGEACAVRVPGEQPLDGRAPRRGCGGTR